MNAGKTVFSQVLGRVRHWEFQRLAQIHDRSDGRRQFSAWDHFLALAFAQMTFRESLRRYYEIPPHTSGFRSRLKSSESKGNSSHGANQRRTQTKGKPHPYTSSKPTGMSNSNCEMRTRRSSFRIPQKNLGCIRSVSYGASRCCGTFGVNGRAN